MKTAEMKIMVPNGWIVNEEVMSDGSRMFVIKPNTTTAEETTCNQQKGIFKKVPASELRLDDEFLKHRPKTSNEESFKARVQNAIEEGLKDFWHPVCDPSFDDDGRICYEFGKRPAVGKSYNWWEKNARGFWPERGSRLGTKIEYVAFLAVLIKELVATGKSIGWAWNAVCNDSRELGHYWNSDNANNDFEPTGTREICGWCDLANTHKVLAQINESGYFYFAGGAYQDCSFSYPLADSDNCGECNNDYRYCCGWLVLETGSTDE